MRTVTANVTCPATVHEAISAWCETDRWPHWVEGCERIESVSADWPAPGGSVRWRSNPAGRGHVTERVVGYDPLEHIESEVEDDQTSAHQLVSFAPVQPPATNAGPATGERTEITIDFAYRITRRSPLTPVMDLLFVRPAMTRSLETTLSRFAAELRARRGDPAD